MPNVQAAPMMAPMASPALMQDPDYLTQVMQAQRRQRLADALTQQGLAPIDYDPRGKISPMQGVSKMAAALLGGYEGNQAIKQQAGQQAMGMQLMMQSLGAGQQGQQVPAQPSPAQASLGQGAQAGSIGPTQNNAARLSSMPSQPPQGPQAPGIPGAVQPTGMNPYGLPPQLIIAAQMGNPAAQEQLKTLLTGQQLTDQQKNSRDPLIGPSTIGNLQTQNMTELQKLQQARQQIPDGSPAAQQLDAAIAKANYLAPVEVKQGNMALDARSNAPIAYNPKVSDGMSPTFTTQNGVTTPTGAQPLPGYARGNAGIAGAEQGAKQAGTIMTVPGPNNQPVTNWGGNLAGTVGANPNLQADMGKRWSDLYGQAGQAQNVISYLQQIKQLAPQADTGQFSDRQQFVNSLLSVAGSEKANDAVSAKNLLDKYSNQIVARLGQGGMGTDAARAIVASAYPNSHMTPQAIQEAADNAIGAQQALQAKTKILQGHYLQANPQGYQQAETSFDQAADPRIFQWKNMPPGPARDQFGKQLLQSDPTIPAKMQALQQMGVQ